MPTVPLSARSSFSRSSEQSSIASRPRSSRGLNPKDFNRPTAQLPTSETKTLAEALKEAERLSDISRIGPPSEASSRQSSAGAAKLASILRTADEAKKRVDAARRQQNPGNPVDVVNGPLPEKVPAASASPQLPMNSRSRSAPSLSAYSPRSESARVLIPSGRRGPMPEPATVEGISTARDEPTERFNASKHDVFGRDYSKVFDGAAGVRSWERSPRLKGQVQRSASENTNVMRRGRKMLADCCSTKSGVKAVVNQHRTSCLGDIYDLSSMKVSDVLDGAAGKSVWEESSRCKKTAHDSFHVRAVVHDIILGRGDADQATLERRHSKECFAGAAGSKSGGLQGLNKRLEVPFIIDPVTGERLPINVRRHLDQPTTPRFLGDLQSSLVQGTQSRTRGRRCYDGVPCQKSSVGDVLFGYKITGNTTSRDISKSQDIPMSARLLRQELKGAAGVYNQHAKVESMRALGIMMTEHDMMSVASSC